MELLLIYIDNSGT